MNGIDFDDILLIPRFSEVNSREDVDISFKSPLLDLEVPIIASPMANIVNAEFAIALSNLGGIAILHRFTDMEQRIEDIGRLESYKFGVAIGLSTDDLDLAEYAVHMGASIICVDVANGYTKSLKEFLLNKVAPITKNRALLMSGNVATFEGYYSLLQHGVDMVRVGIGSGALCTTRNKTGIGVPQITAIMDCFNQGARYGCIVADGGIRNSGDAVKAFAFGANLVMMGSAFASTVESAHNGHIYGMASKELQEQFYGRVKSIEGLAKDVEKTTTLEDYINDFKYSIKSACTYLNVNRLADLSNSGVAYITTGTNSIR